MTILIKNAKGWTSDMVELTRPTDGAPGHVKVTMFFAHQAPQVTRDMPLKRQAQYDRYLAAALADGFQESA